MGTLAPCVCGVIAAASLKRDDRVRMSRSVQRIRTGIAAAPLKRGNASLLADGIAEYPKLHRCRYQADLRAIDRAHRIASTRPQGSRCGYRNRLRRRRQTVSGASTRPRRYHREHLSLRIAPSLNASRFNAAASITPRGLCPTPTKRLIEPIQLIANINTLQYSLGKPLGGMLRLVQTPAQSCKRGTC